MFGRNKKSLAEPFEQRRRPSEQSPQRPATYSYYAKRQVAQPSSSSRTEISPSTRSRTNESPRRSWYTKRSVRFWMFAIIFASIAVELTFLSSSGRVTVIDATGERSTTTDSTAYERTFDMLLAGNVLNHGKLTIDTNGIAAKMQQAYPELESVAVVTPLIGTHPTLYVHLSEPVFVLKQDDASYLLSAAGYITSHGVDGSLPVILDESGETIEVSKQLLPSSHVAFMKTIWYQLTEQGIPASSLVLPKGKAFEVDVRIKEKPFYLKFNIAEDATRQGGAAVAVLQQLGTTSPKEYIDLRVPGKAYYK